MIHVIMLFFLINETSFFFLLIDAFFIDAFSTIYWLFILSINVFVRRLHSSDLNFQFINTNQRFFENESDWFQRIRRKHIVRWFSEFNNLFFSSFSDNNKILIVLSVNFDFDDQIRFFESFNLSNVQITYRTSFDIEKILNKLLRKSFFREICLEKNKYVLDNSAQLIIILFLNSFMKSYFKRRYVKIIQRNIEDNRRCQPRAGE